MVHFFQTTIAHASWQACSCESHYEIRDLGDGHYPRYLPVSLCKQKSCQNKFHQCRLLYYRVSYYLFNYLFKMHYSMCKIDLRKRANQNRIIEIHIRYCCIVPTIKNTYD